MFQPTTMTISHLQSKKSLLILAFLVLLSSAGFGQKILRVGVVGLNHDHVHNIMRQFKKGQAIIVGIAESDQQLIARYKKSYQLPDSLFYNNLTELLAHVRPDAGLGY